MLQQVQTQLGSRSDIFTTIKPKTMMHISGRNFSRVHGCTALNLHWKKFLIQNTEW